MSGREIQKVFAQAMAFCASQGGDCAVYAALLKFSVSQGTPEKAVEVWKAIQRVRLLLHRFPSLQASAEVHCSGWYLFGAYS